MTTPAKRVRVAVFGLGRGGLDCLRLAAARPGLEVVGAVDDHPQRAGRTLTALTGLGQLDGLRVAADLEELFREHPPEVILHAGSPRVLEALPAIRPALELGVSVVSNCAELVFPFLKAPQLSREIDVLCRHTRSRLVATGVNPGFILDVLPLYLSGCCRELTALRATRRVDARTLPPETCEQLALGGEFAHVTEHLRLGTAGHVGLPESVAFLAHGLGWELDEILQEGEALRARQEMTLAGRTIPAGRVGGVHQRARGRRGGRIVIELELRIEAGEPAPYDTLHLEAVPPVTLQLAGGLDETLAAPAMMLHAIPRLLAAAPGLHLATDLSLLRWSENQPGAPRKFHL